MSETLLIGIHDIEGRAIAAPGSWLLHTVALTESPAPALAGDLNLITRLNWGYGATGTLPTSDSYAYYAEAAAAYVQASRGCSRWIVGNEPNHIQERPNGLLISPANYAQCYLQTRAAIHALPGHERDEVLLAAPAPWNNQTIYLGNPEGDWIRYFADQIAACQNQVDGFAIHAYTHGCNPALVQSEARMQPPFQMRHYEFRVYRDYCGAIPDALAHLPIYITEANGNEPWVANGLMPAMLWELAAWNRDRTDRRISSCIFYRYPNYDSFGIQNKPDVVAEYKRASELNLTSPYQLHLPLVGSNIAPLPITDPAIDPRATARGVTVTVADASPVWRVTKVQWYDEQQADALGPDHHILVDVLDEQGQRLPGQAVQVKWPNDSTFILTQAKPGEPYAADYPMSPSRNEFSVQVIDSVPSDLVAGIGMGADTPEGFNPGIHTSTGVIFQRRSGASSDQRIPYWVVAPAGVNLRTKPLDGEVLTALPYGQRVESSDMPTVLGWRFVWVGMLSGWVANQYLSNVVPPVQGTATNGDLWSRSRAFVRRWEGGFQDIYADRGNWTSGIVGVGELKGTNWGISAASYPDLDIRNLTLEQADAIYRRDYWVVSGADRLPWPMCLVVFDTAVLHGATVARNWLQEVGASPLLLVAKRQQVYLNSSDWSLFGKIWLERTTDLLWEAGKQR